MKTKDNQILKAGFVFEFWPDLKPENRQTRTIAYYLVNPEEFLNHLFKLPKIEYGFHGGLQIEIEGHVWENYDEPWFSVRYLDALEKLLKKEVEKLNISVWEESDLHIQRINNLDIEMEESERNKIDEFFGRKIMVNLKEFSQEIVTAFKNYLEFIKKLEEILNVKYLSEQQKLDDRGRTHRQVIEEELFLKHDDIQGIVETIENYL